MEAMMMSYPSADIDANRLRPTLFRLATFFRYDMTSYDATLSNPLVGSSRKRIFGEVMS
jgi:hypothetical protein